MPWPTTTTFLEDCMSPRLSSRYCRNVASCEAAITVCSPWSISRCERLETAGRIREGRGRPGRPGRRGRPWATWATWTTWVDVGEWATARQREGERRDCPGSSGRSAPNSWWWTSRTWCTSTGSPTTRGSAPSRAPSPNPRCASHRRRAAPPGSVPPHPQKPRSIPGPASSARRRAAQAKCYAQRCRISLARPASAHCKNGPKLIRPTPSGPKDAGSA